MEPRTPQYRKLAPNVLAATTNRLARRLRDAERTGRGLDQINAILDGDIVQVTPTDPNATRVIVTITRVEYVAEFGEEPPTYREAVEARNARIEAGYQKRLATLAANRGDQSAAGAVSTPLKARAAQRNGQLGGRPPLTPEQAAQREAHRREYRRRWQANKRAAKKSAK